MRSQYFSLLALAIALLGGCAKQFPRPIADRVVAGLTGPGIFAATLSAHGGDRLSMLTDVNVSLEGDWKFLITKIQPLVTDHKYRVRSEERLMPKERAYAAYYRGPAGTKKVVRTRAGVEVFYNDLKNDDSDVVASTALTADSFLMFLLGPFGLAGQELQFQRLDDVRERGKIYHRIYAVLEPGLGFSTRDEVVLWIDAESKLTYRMHNTLEGYKTTQAAHVDVTFLEYQKVDDFIFPTRFLERVRGPLSIDAHEWQLTGLDINRGYDLDALGGPQWHGAAATSAEPLRPER